MPGMLRHESPTLPLRSSRLRSLESDVSAFALSTNCDPVSEHVGDFYIGVACGSFDKQTYVTDVIVGSGVEPVHIEKAVAIDEREIRLPDDGRLRFFFICSR